MAASQFHGTGRTSPRSAAQAFGIARAICSQARHRSDGTGAARSTRCRSRSVSANRSGDSRIESGRPDRTAVTAAKSDHRQLARRWRRCASKKCTRSAGPGIDVGTRLMLLARRECRVLWAGRRWTQTSAGDRHTPGAARATSTSGPPAVPAASQRHHTSRQVYLRMG